MPRPSRRMTTGSRRGHRPRTVSLPTIDPPGRRSRRSRWRAATLAGVYLLFAIHVAHWQITGRSLAPLELNEVMYTLELGIVTAGFLFMLAAAASVVVFGRFFCSWGCHILALEDLCAWLLKRVGIRPKPVRSRAMMLIAPGAMFYMFIWPQISRLARGEALPRPRLLGDADGWASFITTDFWRNLPGPAIALMTFAVCGFAIVYFLGSRSFCTYVCPYGVLFGLADRIAPGRIIVDPDRCIQCGHCTAACTTHIRVHDETRVFGSVVSPGCLKDLDCVDACPQGALRFGFTRPALFRSLSWKGRRRLRADFSLGEEALVVGGFLVTLVIYRGLYGYVPFLMALGLGVLLGYAGVLGVRLVRRADVRLNPFQLKIKGRLTRAGWAAVAVLLAAGTLSAHSGFIRYHQFMGYHAFERMRSFARQDGADPPASLVDTALGHLRVWERWGLIRPPALNRMLGSICLFRGEPILAERYFRRVLDQDPGDLDSSIRLAQVLAARGETDRARRLLEPVASSTATSSKTVRHSPRYRATAMEMLGAIDAARGDAPGAIAWYRKAVEQDPDRVSAWMALGEAQAGGGDLEGAEASFRRVVKLKPDLGEGQYNLGVVLSMLGRQGEAIERFGRAIELDPSDADSLNNLGLLLLQGGDADEAIALFERAIQSRPDFAHAHFNLARALDSIGRAKEAAGHLREAARLDPQYARFIRGG